MLVRRILVDDGVDTVWISVYPANIRNMKEQVEPYAAIEFSSYDPATIKVYGWYVGVNAIYLVEG